ncbi:MAG: hypothetical protein AB7J40_00970 [Candidatus Altimarinota bacterium]
MAVFPKYYQKLAIYSRIDRPRFEFGLSAMILQGLVVSYLYPLVADQWLFGLGLFITLESFMVFAEVGKQDTSSLGGFLLIQTSFCALQALIVTLIFGFIPFL